MNNQRKPKKQLFEDLERERRPTRSYRDIRLLESLAGGSAVAMANTQVIYETQLSATARCFKRRSGIGDRGIRGRSELQTAK